METLFKQFTVISWTLIQEEVKNKIYIFDIICNISITMYNLQSYRSMEISIVTDSQKKKPSKDKSVTF